MKTIQDIASEIVAREGSFVDHPADPGGATQHGVTLGALQRGRRDLTGDGRIDVQDVRAVTPDIARDLFIAQYFKAPQLDLLPDSLQASVFDMYVNAGRNAVKILQRLLRQMGQDISVDGHIGPQTVAAAHAAAAVSPDHLSDAYGIARRNYYLRLADLRPASRVFARSRKGGKGGWVLRAEAFIHPRYHLSAAEFAARIASWH